MKIQVSIVMILLFAPIGSGIFAQQAEELGKSTIHGKIYDAETAYPLGLAHVEIQPLGLVTVTDDLGSYRFVDLPEGTYQLSFSVLGYEQLARDSFQLGHGENLEFNVQLAFMGLEAQEVVVTASRRSQALSLAPASVAIVHSEEIEQRNLQTFDQAFDEMTGVQVTRSSGSNVQALSIRGASEVAGGGIGNRVLLLIDGRPSLSPESGGALWNLVPLQSIDRIEVVKGAYSSLFGSSAMGGVINVITKSPKKKPSTSGHLNYGIYGRAPSNSEYGRTDNFYSAEISHSGGRGNWKYLIDAGRKYNEGHREKSAFEINHLFGKVVFDPNKKDTWTLSGNLNAIKNDAPATWINRRLAYTVAPHRKDDYQDKKEYNLDLSFRSLRSGDLKYQGRTYYYRNYSFFSFNDDPENKTETNVNFGLQSVDEETVLADRVGASGQVDLHKGKHYFLAGGDFKYDRVDGRPDTVLYGKHSSATMGLYAQDEIELGKSVIATIGLRYDYFHLENQLNEANLSPKIALVWKPSDRLSLRTLFAQAFRNPSMAERFIKFEQGGGLRFEPNPGLRAEKLNSSIEVGGGYKIGPSATIDVAFFRNRYRDLISFRQLPDPRGALVYRVINLSKATMQGLEINFRTKIGKYVETKLGYTYLDARDESENRLNNNLAYKVKHSVVGSVRAAVSDYSLFVSGRYRSAIKEVFIYPGNEPGAYAIFNAKFAYTIDKVWSAYFSVDNLTNSKYEELERYRMPGRSFTVGLRFGIGT